ncbi:S1 family peptidase [Roseateles toxinivorans]|uniref:Trypsin-like peptidase n=1 Tax=Roseateles toxinivorans TaxID=270368 RepID=A0A4R6QUK3_9BURK|nr:serine protease [Roseateles toxinivorans]TDP74592.1 trypsin-like peptidase [Roseateles toxinivorans]
MMPTSAAPLCRGALQSVLTVLLGAGLGLLLMNAAHAGLVEVISQVKPSVLAVGTFNSLSSPRFGFRGTGFVVGDGNLLVTNAHVLPDAASAERDVKLVVLLRRGIDARDSEIAAARIIRVDKASDLALLRFEGPALPALQLADPAHPREGLSIALMGFPIGGALGFSPVTHRGIIAAVTPIALPAGGSSQLNERAIRRLRQGSFNILQLDATAYPGNSGGPVFDAETGGVVGVVNMVLVKGSKETALTHPSGISYAIPVSFVRELLSEP